MNTNITAVKGTATVNIVLEGNATVADLAANAMAAAVLDLSDEFTVIRNGIELASDATLQEGDEVEVANKAGGKGSFLIVG